MVAANPTEPRMTAREAADWIERTHGLRVHPDTVKRWSRRGYLVRGVRLRLPTRRVGVRHVVTAADLAAFLATVEEAESQKGGEVQAAG